MANRYFVGTASSSGNVVGSWSTFSNGPGGASLPTTNDSVYFDSFSPTCSTWTVGVTLTTMDFTGYFRKCFLLGSGITPINLVLSPSMSFDPTIAITTQLTCASTLGTWSGYSIPWPGSLYISGNSTTNFTDNFVVYGNVTTNAAEAVATINGGTLSCYGNFTVNASGVNGQISGTTNILLCPTASKSASFANNTSCNVRPPVYINPSPTGNLTMSNNYNPAGTVAKLTYLGGTVSADGLIINVAANYTNDTNTLKIGTYNLSGVSVVNTLLSTLICATLSCAALTFTSSIYGFNADNFASTGNITLRSGVTYSVNKSFSMSGTLAAPLSMSSSPTGSYAYFNILNGATLTIAYVNATDIDSSGGQLLWDYKGTLTRTINWRLLTPPGTITNIWCS